MISKTMRAILHTLSYGNIEVESSRRLVDIKKLDAMNIFLKKMDIQIFNEDYEIPLRIYFPTEEAMTNGVEKGHTFPVLLFFHGGGWVTESVDTYNRVCARMSQSTGHIVVSVEYRLAPEYRFPTALMDCYAAAKALYTNKLILNTDPRKITIMGEIVRMDGFGEKSWQRLWDAIQQSRNTTFERYLISMDIPMIGNTASKVLGRVFHYDLDEFRDAVYGGYDFRQLPDFGETLHNNIHD